MAEVPALMNAGEGPPFRVIQRVALHSERFSTLEQKFNTDIFVWVPSELASMVGLGRSLR